MKELKTDNVDIDLTEVLQVFDLSVSAPFDAFRLKLAKLRNSSPQLLHLEGGNISQRVSFAYYYAAMHICQDHISFEQSIGEVNSKLGFNQALQAPCLTCVNCLKVASNSHSDLLIFDGRTESIKVEPMRELKVAVGEMPRHGNKRVVIFLEADKLTTASANTLLKVLEEPLKHTLFIFTTSQRQNLLPTLISRGFVLTLPWISNEGASRNMWEEELANFFKGSSGFLDKISQKGMATSDLAKEFIVIIQKNLAEAMSKPESSSPLCQVMKNITSYAEANLILAKAEDAMQYLSNPAYVIQSMLTQLYNIIHK